MLIKMETTNFKKGDKVDFLCAGVPTTGLVMECSGKECRVSCGGSVVAVNVGDVVLHKEETSDDSVEKPTETKPKKGRKSAK
jgi:hypothetical protein